MGSWLVAGFAGGDGSVILLLLKVGEIGEEIESSTVLPSGDLGPG